MHEQKPRISVIMGVHNGERYLQGATDSVLSQTFTDFEFVIINDASTDKTAEILAGHSDPRLRLFNNEQNIGLARTLNRAIELARGEYIARQDADDLSEPLRLEKQVAFLDSHPEVAVVGTTTKWIDDNDKVIEVWHQPTDNSSLQETLLDYCCLIHGSTMYRNQTIQEVGAYDDTMRTGQDYDLWLRMSEAWNLASLPDVLYRYRRHQEMASVKQGVEQTKHAQTALARALQRRTNYIKLAWGFRDQRAPSRLAAMSRRQLAQRYVWWSAGARECSKHAALTFLLAALLFDPGYPALWDYLKGVGMRKFTKLATQVTTPAATIHPGDT